MFGAEEGCQNVVNDVCQAEGFAEEESAFSREMGWGVELTP
jgi:hypothetical protein